MPEHPPAAPKPAIAAVYRPYIAARDALQAAAARSREAHSALLAELRHGPIAAMEGGRTVVYVINRSGEDFHAWPARDTMDPCEARDDTPEPEGFAADDSDSFGPVS